MKNENTKKITKKDRTIKRILRVTKRLIKDNGYANVSTNQIAKEVGVSIGLIYKYFDKGKPDIVKKIIMDSGFMRGFTGIKLESINQDLENMQKFSKKPAIELLKTFFRLYIMYTRRMKKIIAALEIAYLSDKRSFKDSEEFDLDDFYKPIIDTISKLLLFIGKENDMELSKVLFNIFNTTIVRHVIFGKITETDEKLTNYLADVFLGYIKLEGGDNLF